MASKTDTSTAGYSDPSTVSAAALRLDPLLRKIRDGLSQYLEAFALAIQGARRQDIKWPLFMVVVPDPGDGGTIDVVQQQAGDFVGFDNFAICKYNIPVSEADIETAASYLRHCGLDPDAQRLLEVFQGLKAAFCSVAEFVPLSDGSMTNRKFYAQDRAFMLSEHLEELARTLPTVLTGGNGQPPAGNDSPKEDTPPKTPSGKEPPNAAWQAYYVRETLRITNQTEIAEKMTKQGTPATQGQVSRWLKAVDAWLEAGGIKPTLEELHEQPKGIDPAKLDMGARQDGRTPRQRDKMTDPADDWGDDRD